MQQTKETITEEAFLDAIYKNAKMGADSIINLLPKVEDDAMRSVMTAQLDGYERYAAPSQSLQSHTGQRGRAPGARGGSL